LIIPNSRGSTLIWRRSRARMAPLVMGISYCFPVRLSVMVRVSRGAVRASDLGVWVAGWTGCMARGVRGIRQRSGNGRISLHQEDKARNCGAGRGVGGDGGRRGGEGGADRGDHTRTDRRV